jgi:hypothetical protein
VDCVREVGGAYTAGTVPARSWHRGGIVHAGSLDGSVRAYSPSIPLQTWRALGTAAGGGHASDDY